MSRKYVPAEAYRFLALVALESRRGAPASKGELAWETRANHYMITRVLRELAAEGFVRVDAAAAGGYEVRLTESGADHAAKGREYARRTFRALLSEHFRYGRAPAWVASLVA